MSIFVLSLGNVHCLSLLLSNLYDILNIDDLHATTIWEHTFVIILYTALDHGLRFLFCIEEFYVFCLETHYLFEWKPFEFRPESSSVKPW